jgi:hypothetical protein
MSDASSSADRSTLSRWVDGNEPSRPIEQQESQPLKPVDVASELVVHGLLKELVDRDGGTEEHRINRVLEAIDIDTVVVRKPRRVPIPMMAAVAACLLVVAGFTIWLLPQDGQKQIVIDRDSSTESVLASVVQVVDAEFGDSSELRIGDRLSPRTIQLQSGFVRLAFDDGVEVTLQGPAEYELLTAGMTKLNSGLLTATVPPGAEGFTVDTPTAEIVDFGTAFGIDLRDDGVSRVSVFEGEVEVSTADSGESKRLKEGDAVRVATGEVIETVDFDPEPFTKLWPIASGVERSTEAFQFVPPWPRQIKLIRSDTDIFILPEGRPATLDSPLRVNAALPGEYSREESLTTSDIAIGQRIRSFLLLFHPEKAGPRVIKPVSGSITFDAPVLGLIVRHEELQASTRQFLRRGPRSLREEQQLELTGEEDGDVITLSEDGRTVTLDLKSRARRGELMRVIVDASNGTADTTDSAGRK